MTPWSGRGTDFQTLDRATRWPLYGLSASEVFFVQLQITGDPQFPAVQAGMLMVLALAHAVACIALLRAGLAYHLGGRRPAILLVVLPVVLCLTGVLVASQVGGGADGGLGFERSPSGEIALTFCAALTGALASLLSVGRLFVAVAVPTVAVSVLETVAESSPRVWAVYYAIATGSAAITYRFSVWFLGIIWEVSRSRDVQAKLAVAEERLRFARDLHDTLGRNLALIAVNSQLAAELLRRGQDGALERMLDVHRTAQDSMREVREVVAGSRATDLDSELAGARSVLRSAGITVRVVGDGVALPPQAQAALGWVVREATTNIIRHSDSTAVRIDLDGGVAVGSVGLRIENDGVAGPGVENQWGTGLTGLRERLVALGGDLAAGTESGGRFVVQARLPLQDQPLDARLVPERES